MMYLLAILVPWFSIILIGKVFTGILFTILYLLTILFFPPVHIVFVIVAWLLIAQTRREKETDKIIDSMESHNKRWDDR